MIVYIEVLDRAVCFKRIKITSGFLISTPLINQIFNQIHPLTSLKALLTSPKPPLTPLKPPLTSRNPP